MDFLKILKSFEEFVYEALSWFVLLPMTMVRIIAHPLRMSAYAAAELERAEDTRFDNTVSPPLLLILCVLIAHFVDLAIDDHYPGSSGTVAGTIFASEQNALLYRTLAFGIWALAGAVYLLLQTRIAVGRGSLRAPFYQQCYLISPFALLVSVNQSMEAAKVCDAKVTACIFLGALTWFWLVQIAWVRRAAHLSLGAAVLAATVIVVIGSGANAITYYAIPHGPA